jgi:zinc transport system substrate-binding protein
MRIVLILGAIVAALAGCGGSGDASGGRTAVVAAFYPLAFAAERIGGEDVEVRNVTPPGTEPHDVELSAREVERVRSADVVLYLGGGFQPSLERAVDGADGEAVDLLEGLELRAGDEDAEHAVDPHVWLDPVLFADIARRIGHALPGASAGGLQRDLRALDREFRDGLRDCERRTIVTSHAAFGYLAARYGLEEVPITGVSPETEPTPRQLEAIVREVEATGATTIFFETLLSPRLAETVARETGARTAVLNPIEGLTPEQADAGASYFSLMRDNLASLRGALGCR